MPRGHSSDLTQLPTSGIVAEPENRDKRHQTRPADPREKSSSR